jgi:hypothetical protein
MSDENASWDVAYNGSSFRFVKLTKVKNIQRTTLR